jgi:hypothetical protein
MIFLNITHNPSSFQNNASEIGTSSIDWANLMRELDFSIEST